MIETMIESASTMTSPRSSLMVFPLGGAAARVDELATAFGNRSVLYDYYVFGVWEDPEESQRHKARAKAFMAAIRPLDRGVYVNELTHEDTNARVREAYPPATYERLVAVKNKYDPGNLFRHNQNIKPTV